MALMEALCDKEVTAALLLVIHYWTLHYFAEHGDSHPGPSNPLGIGGQLPLIFLQKSLER